MMVEKIAYSVHEVANALGVNEKSVRKGITAGEIPHIRIGRLFKVPAYWVRAQLSGSGAREVA